MSLLEDIVDLLRCVLEYFGVPPDMLVPVWDSTYCGQYRSIVRLIGTNLPLSPQPRLRFQIPLQTFSRLGHIDVTVDTPAIPTLADVLWLVEDEGDSHTKFRNAVPLRKALEIPSLGSERPLAVSVPVQRGGGVLGQGIQPEALQKISALEEELQRLRAQIAMIVTVPAVPSVFPADPGTPSFTPLPVPVLTSTPVCPPLPPPPPPPPQLHPTAMGSCVEVSVSDVIRQRRAAKREKLGPCDPSVSKAPAVVPSMLEVLKDLNQVQLRSVERSPGGTPVRRRRSKGVACSSDPAALIAEALKRKFAHKLKDDSFGKENCSAEPSPFSSPDTPRIVPHTRRSQGRIHL